MVFRYDTLYISTIRMTSRQCLVLTVPAVCDALIPEIFGKCVLCGVGLIRDLTNWKSAYKRHHDVHSESMGRSGGRTSTDVAIINL